MDRARQGSPKPLLEASALPAECYTDAEFFRAEIAHIHRRNWFFAGRADELASPGDYRAIETVGGPVIVLRDRAGDLRAFANCCRHRGSLLLEGSGNVRAIACPYHGWGYRLDGTLMAAPDMETTIGFDKAEHGLAPIRLATWQGFIFLNFDDGAPDLPAHLGNLPELLGSYRFDEMICTWRQEIECRCNWKLLVENALESYHTGLVHAATVGAQLSVTPATSGEWLTLQVLSETSIAVLSDAPPFPPIEGLSEEARRGTYFTMILPTPQFACAETAARARFVPLSARPPLVARRSRPRGPQLGDGAASRRDVKRYCRPALRSPSRKRSRSLRCLNGSTAGAVARLKVGSRARIWATAAAAFSARPFSA